LELNETSDPPLANLESQNSVRGLPRVDPLTSTLNPVGTAGDGSPTTRDRLAVLETVPIEVEVQRFGSGTSAMIVTIHSTLV